MNKNLVRASSQASPGSSYQANALRKTQAHSRLPQHRNDQHRETTNADDSEKACADRLIG